MRVEFPQSDPETERGHFESNWNACKFALMEAADDLVLLLFNFHRKHVGVVLDWQKTHPDNEFIGAGQVTGVASLTRWDSGSCETAFGRDKPSENADALLAQVRECALKVLVPDSL